MLDISSWEIMVVLVAALLVVGPAKLPGLARTVGQWVGKIRGMAREFQRSLEDAAREADLDELRQTTNSIRDLRQTTNSIRDAGRMTSPTAWAEKAFKTDTDDPGATAAETPPSAPSAKPESASASVAKPADGDADRAAKPAQFADGAASNTAAPHPAAESSSPSTTPPSDPS